MFPIGVVIIGFFYLMSMGYYLADQVFLTPAGIDVENLQGLERDPARFLNEDLATFNATAQRALTPATNTGTVFDQVLGFSEGGFRAVWDVMSLLTGSYFLATLNFIGVPEPLVYVLQLIFGVVAVRTLIYFILGR